MSNFKERLATENNELVEKIGKLEDFLNSDKVKGVAKIQLSLLNIQLTAMQTYQTCVMTRIDNL